MKYSEIALRFTYHSVAAPAKIRALQDIRRTARALAHLVNVVVPEGREQATAITKLEEAVMWANAGIARQQDEPDSDEDTWAITTTGEAALAAAKEAADGR